MAAGENLRGAGKTQYCSCLEYADGSPGNVRYPPSRYCGYAGDEDSAQGPSRRHGSGAGMGCLLQSAKA